MAKPVKFGSKKKADPSFNFGFNRLSKSEKKAFRKSAKSGGRTGGGS